MMTVEVREKAKKNEMRQIFMGNKSRFIRDFLIVSISSLVIGIILIHYEDIVTHRNSQAPEKTPEHTSSPPEPQHLSRTEEIGSSSPSGSNLAGNQEPIVQDTVVPPKIVTPPPPSSLPSQPIFSTDKPSPQPATISTFSDNPPVADDLVAQLKRLHNPYAPVTVNLWFDERGKTHFSSRHKVIINYEINGLKKGTPVYLTLLNVSPAEKLSMLFSEPVEAGKVYGSWQTGQYATTVKQTYLEAGQEYFKAIVTSEPIDWKAFIAAAAKEKPRMTFWGTEELTVVVD